MSVVSGLAAQAAVFMDRAGYSPGSCVSYQRVWSRFEEYCAEGGVQQPDRDTAARFCAAVGADGAEQWQVFYRRAVGCLFDVVETGRFALRAGRGRIAVPEVFTAEFEVYLASLAGRGSGRGDRARQDRDAAPVPGVPGRVGGAGDGGGQRRGRGRLCSLAGADGCLQPRWPVVLPARVSAVRGQPSMAPILPWAPCSRWSSPTGTRCCLRSTGQPRSPGRWPRPGTGLSRRCGIGR